MKKKILVLVLSLVMVLATTAAVLAAEPADRGELGGDTVDDLLLTGAASLPAPTALAWSDSQLGLATWGTVEGAEGYSVQLYKNSSVHGGAVYITDDDVTSCDLLQSMAGSGSEHGSGNYSFTVQAVKDGATCEISDKSAVYPYIERPLDMSNYSYRISQVSNGKILAVYSGKDKTDELSCPTNTVFRFYQSSSSAAGHYIAVKSAGNYIFILDGVNTSLSGTSPISLANYSNTSLYLLDENTIAATGASCVSLESSASLTIQGSGSLTANSSSNSNACVEGVSGSNVTINSGTVRVSCSDFHAIKANNLTITGGTLGLSGNPQALSCTNSSLSPASGKYFTLGQSDSSLVDAENHISIIVNAQSLDSTNQYITLSTSDRPRLSAPTGAAWSTAAPAKATWTQVTGADSYSVQLYKDGSVSGGAVPTTDLFYDFATSIVTGGNYTFKVTALPANDSVNMQSLPSEASSGYTAYAITYDLNGGALAAGESNPAGCHTGTAVFTLSNPTKTGYSFNGWTGSNGTTPNPSVTVTPSDAAGDLTYTANWTADSYTVIYEDNNATTAHVGGDGNYTVETTSFTLPTTRPQKTGYVFEGWMVTSAATGGTGFALGDTFYAATCDLSGSYGDVTLTAQWRRKYYSVTYVDNGTTTQYADGDSGYSIETTSFTLPTAPVKAGYDFAGWKVTAAATGGTGFALNDAFNGTSRTLSGAYGNVTLTAQWTAASYAVTYLDNGADTPHAGGDSSYTIETTAVTLPTAPAKAGYDFAGWKVTAAATGGTGFILNDAFNTATRTLSGAYGNVTLTAQWTAASYTVTYLDNGADTPHAGGDSSYSIETASVTLPTAPARTGYDFAGWKVTAAADGGTGFILNDAFTGTSRALSAAYGNVTLTAQWTAASYTVTYLENGTTTPHTGGDSSYTIETTAVTLPTAPMKTGYDFAGWKVTAAAEGGTGFALNDAFTGTSRALSGAYGNVTLTAQWTAASYAVTYLDNGATTPHAGGDGSYTIETTAVTLPTAPAKTGYDFAGWKVTAAATGGTGFTLNDAFNGTSRALSGSYGNVTLTAQWTAASYTITYQENGATTPHTGGDSSYTIETTAVTLPTAPAKTGYDFAGWKVTAAATGGTGFILNDAFNTATRALSGAYGNVTLTAQWTAKNYAITYQDKGGAAFSGTHETSYPTRHTYDAATTLKSASRTGYSFNGWFTSSDCSGSPLTSLAAAGYTAPITLYAKWTLITYTVSYNVGTGSGKVPASEIKSHGTDYPVSDSCLLSKYGYTQTGWKLGSESQDGSGAVLTLTANENAVLYPVWTCNTYAVKLTDSDIGITGFAYKVNDADSWTTYHSEFSVNHGDKLEIKALLDTGYTFTQWASGTTDHPLTIASVTGAINYTPTSRPVFTLAVTGTTAIIAGQSTTLTALPAGGSGTYTSYSWYVGSDTAAAFTSGSICVNPSETTSYKVAVSDGMETKEASVTVTVAPATYEISVTPASHDFGNLTAGYLTAPAAQTFTITNHGNSDITGFTVTGAGSDYTITYTTGVIAAGGGTAAFTVQPKTALGVGAHDDTLTIATTPAQSSAVTVNVQFVVDAIAYGVTEGQNGTYTPGADLGLAFTADAAFAKFRGVKVDGVLLTENTDYTAISGSTIVTLKPEYLRTLSPGTHTLTVLFDDGAAAADFQIEQSSHSSTVSSYILRFESNGGTAIGSVTRTSGATIDLSGYSVTREGYDFAGWYSDSALTNQVVSVLLTRNTTVYAKWTENAPAELPFTDVSKGSWFYDDVVYVYENKLMQGTGDIIFDPDGAASRGMIVAILYRLDGQPAVNRECPFTDVKPGSYYENAVTWATEHGIVGGYGSGMFGPDDPITREQMAAILYRYAAYLGCDVTGQADLTKFGDYAAVSAYAEQALAWASKEQLIHGVGDSLLDPSGRATRAQAAAILHRFSLIVGK